MSAPEQNERPPAAPRRATPAGGLRVEELALFLDVDGTLLEIAPTPAAVIVGADLLDLLRLLTAVTRGAVAFVSGRSIATLDNLFHPLILPAAGLHGFERRAADGTFHRHPLPRGELLSRAREAFTTLVDAHAGLLLEDKRFALALHYRQAPELEDLVLERTAAILQELAPDFELQRGRCVVELRPAGASKAGAVATFMSELPFVGRRPVFLGDDLTDETAFDWVNRAGGLSIAVGVGHESFARAHLASVSAARMWLQRLVQA